MTNAYGRTKAESLTNRWYQNGFKHKLSRFQKGKARLIKKVRIIQDDTYSLSTKWHVACRISVVYIGYQIIFIKKLKKSNLTKFQSGIYLKLLLSSSDGGEEMKMAVFQNGDSRLHELAKS